MIMIEHNHFSFGGSIQSSRDLLKDCFIFYVFKELLLLRYSGYLLWLRWELITLSLILPTLRSWFILIFSFIYLHQSLFYLSDKASSILFSKDLHWILLKSIFFYLCPIILWYSVVCSKTVFFLGLPYLCSG